MGQKKSVLVMRDTGMNNNEILAEKLSTDWEVQILFGHFSTRLWKYFAFRQVRQQVISQLLDVAIAQAPSE